MKKIVLAVLLLTVLCVISACGGENIPGEKDVSDKNKSDQQITDVEEEADPADLDIMIAGEKVSLPFDLDVLTKKGYTFVDSEQEQMIYEGADQKVPLVVMTNDNEQQQQLYGSPYLNINVYCGSNSKNSMNDVTVTGFMLQTVEKQYLSVNGFGWKDNTADFMNTINHEYDELIGQYDSNITSGAYTVVYTFSDLIMTVNSKDGEISSIEVRAVD